MGKKMFILLCLIPYYGGIGCTRLYLKARTSKAPKYLPVQEIRMLLFADEVDTILAFHAIMGCDSVWPW